MRIFLPGLQISLFLSVVLFPRQKYTGEILPVSIPLKGTSLSTHARLPFLRTMERRRYDTEAAKEQATNKPTLNASEAKHITMFSKVRKIYIESFYYTLEKNDFFRFEGWKFIIFNNF